MSVRSTLRIILIILLLPFSSICLFAQNPFTVFSKLTIGVEFETGASIPATKSIRDVYFAGINASAGVKIATLKSQKLWIKPVGGIKWYFKEIEKENAVTEHFRNLKAGLEFQYNILQRGSFTFYPLIRIDHNWCANYYSATYYTGTGFNNTAVEKSDKYLKGNGFSADVGIRMQNRNWYLKIDYEAFKPVLYVHQDLIDAAYNEGYIVAPDCKFNFNSFNIGVGTDLIFNK